MSKSIIIPFVTLVLLFLVSCGTTRVADLRSLSVGMSKAEVAQTIGSADRVLAVNATENGYQEILEFRTYYNEVYAVEFIDNRMVGYEFLYEDSPTVVTGAIVPMYPIGYNRPIYHVQPNRPTRPNVPSRPTIPSRPNTSQPTRPNVESTRPVDKNPTETTRPSGTREVKKD